MKDVLLVKDKIYCKKTLVYLEVGT